MSPRLGESSIFKVQSPPNVTFSTVEPLPKISSILEAHGWGGGGTPRENLSGLAGPPLVSKILIGTGTAMRLKRTTPAGGLGAKLEAVGKKP